MSTRVIITKGVSGGFLPAKPSLVFILKQSNTFITISGSYLLDDKYIDIPAENLENVSILSTVESLVKLPMETPMGSEDIYHLDTSIQVISDEFGNWQNMPNQGCSIIPSSSQPTNAQKQEFKQILDLLLAYLPQSVKIR